MFPYGHNGAFVSLPLRNSYLFGSISYSTFLILFNSGFIVPCFGLALPLTFSGLAKVAIFTTNVDAENQTLINHKCVCGALNRHFCQTRVSTSPFLSVLFVRCHFLSVLVRWLCGSFAFFDWLCAVAKKQMCHKKRWLF